MHPLRYRQAEKEKMNLWVKFQLILTFSLIVNNDLISQSNNDMEENYIILKDEFPISEERVKKFENEKGIKLPKDYRNFILEFNGGTVIPNYPISEKLKTEIFPIERFYSLQDIELGVIANQRERIEYIIDDINSGKEYLERGKTEWGFDIEFENLIFIGVCERGTLHLYCGENGYGEIWYSNYSGGEGLQNTGLKSFTELLNSLSSLDEEWIFDKSNPIYKNWESAKIFTFDYFFYWEDDIKEKSLQRFKEVLSSYGDPNKIIKFKNTDVVNYYLNYPFILKYLIESGAKFPKQLNRINNLESLKYLVFKGANVEGLLNSTRNIETIKFLIEDCNQDLNKPFNGEYPLLNYTNLDGGYSDWSRNSQYKLVKKVLDLGFEINLELKDENGQSVNERIKILKDHHIMYKEKYKKE